ncbi:MAG: GIY-YIG nuclease family protein [Motiliproteus sp.]
MQTTVSNGGVYAIAHRSPQETFHHTYIGSTDNFEKRFSEHRRDLEAGVHDCKKLQQLWSNCGGKNTFKFEPLVHIPENLKIPKDYRTKKSPTIKRFREAVEQLCLSHVFNDPLTEHMNTNRMFDCGREALILVNKVLAIKDNVQMFEFLSLVGLDLLLKDIKEGLEIGHFRHMRSGDAKNFSNGSRYRGTHRLNRTYNVPRMEGLYQKYIAGQISYTERYSLAELMRYNAVGKLHKSGNQYYPTQEYKQ